MCCLHDSIRAICVKEGCCTIGLGDSTIMHGSCPEDMKAVMKMHGDGEAWGLGCTDSQVITSGDDNRICMIDPKGHTAEHCSFTSRNQRARKGKPGVQNRKALPHSQQSRAVAINAKDGCMAVAGNDGTVEVRGMGW